MVTVLPGWVLMQVSNAKGAVVSEEAMVEVEAVDILSIIERFVEERQITFQSLFRQYNRSKVCTTGLLRLSCLGRGRMHDCRGHCEPEICTLPFAITARWHEWRRCHMRQ